MSRAQDAFDQLETAAVVLSMCAMFCQDNVVYPDFKKYWQARSSMWQNTPERAAMVKSNMEMVDPQMLANAVTTMRTFLQGYADNLRKVPDKVLDAQIRAACTHGADCHVPGHPKGLHGPSLFGGES